MRVGENAPGLVQPEGYVKNKGGRPRRVEGRWDVECEAMCRIFRKRMKILKVTQQRLADILGTSRGNVAYTMSTRKMKGASLKVMMEYADALGIVLELAIAYRFEDDRKTQPGLDKLLGEEIPHA